MKYQHLLAVSRAQLAPQSMLQQPLSFKMFTAGAAWMCHQLNAIGNQQIDFNSTIPYGRYGLLKYVSCIAIAIVVAIFCVQINAWLLPMMVPFFYVLEVHFLFLFPLLLDRVPAPIVASIRHTYRIGLFKCVLVVMPIGLYMVSGLIDWKNPFYKWHVGALAILNWYQDEVRNRL